ncbi:uncharacterized protein LOC130050974 [Ostrea edulis]|uniref:uncharacterized protein LOC130050974 n=1 Tax=Ostrea edulis TaxID=37623 RepID=UPI0024AF7BEB|nr:uncharacterized protein LOC130050974 [Ostrea edulis]
MMTLRVGCISIYKARTEGYTQGCRSPSSNRAMQICLILTALLAHISGITGCTCIPRDHQTKYCESSNVVIANVTGMTGGERIPGIGQRIYDVDILHVYKGTMSKGPAQVVTAGSESVCGVKLSKTAYLLNGDVDNGKLRIRLCSMFSPYPLLDTITIFPLDTYYDCRCKAKYMIFGAAEKNTCNLAERARRCPPESGALGDRPECRYNEGEDKCEWDC